jgi:hypothetical protein
MVYSCTMYLLRRAPDIDLHLNAVLPPLVKTDTSQSHLTHRSAGLQPQPPRDPISRPNRPNTLARVPATDVRTPLAVGTFGLSERTEGANLLE